MKQNKDHAFPIDYCSLANKPFRNERADEEVNTNLIYLQSDYYQFILFRSQRLYFINALLKSYQPSKQ